MRVIRDSRAKDWRGFASIRGSKPPIARIGANHPPSTNRELQMHGAHSCIREQFVAGPVAARAGESPTRHEDYTMTQRSVKKGHPPAGWEPAGGWLGIGAAAPAAGAGDVAHARILTAVGRRTLMVLVNPLALWTISTASLLSHKALGVVQKSPLGHPIFDCATGALDGVAAATILSTAQIGRFWRLTDRAKTTSWTIAGSQPRWTSFGEIISITLTIAAQSFNWSGGDQR